MRALLNPLLFCFMIFTASSVEAQQESALALVIGNNASPINDNTLEALNYADDDALRFSSLFSRFSETVESLIVLDAQTQRRYPNAGASMKSPTLGEVSAAVERLRIRAKALKSQNRRVQLYVYFSGHGAENKEGVSYLALLDGELTGRALYEDIAQKVGADRTHLIIDACNAGALVAGRGRFDNESDAREVPLSKDALASIANNPMRERFPTVGAIVASSAGQQTHEWSRIESGVFSHELLSALLGPGDVNGDLRVEYSEVQAFVAAANSKVSDPRARPTIIANAPSIDGRAPLLELSRFKKTAFIEGPYRFSNAPLSSERFYIELQNGQRYLDANLEGGAKSAIAIPSDAPVFVRTASLEARAFVSAGKRIKISELRFSERATKSRGALDENYQRELFAAPFTETYYQGFIDSRNLVGVEFERSGTKSVFEQDAQKGMRFYGASGSLAVGALLGLGAATTGIFAGLTKLEFDATNIQAEAVALESRYNTLLVGSALLSAATLAFVGAGLIAYPYGE